VQKGVAVFMRAYGIASLMPACVIPGRRKSGRMLMRLATPLSTRRNKVSSAVSSLMEILVTVGTHKHRHGGK
jgi:hypothetical protein